MNYQPFSKETFPEHIKYVKDTEENREILSLKLETPKFVQPKSDCYIEVNMKDKTCKQR